MTYDELINLFLFNEKKIKLNKVSSLYYLQTRFYLFRKYQSLLLSNKNKNARKNKITFTFLFFEIIAFIFLFIKLPFFLFSKKKYFFAEHSRYQFINNKFVEPYSFLSQKKVLLNNFSLIRVGTLNNGLEDICPFNRKIMFFSDFQFKFFSVIIGLIFFPITLMIYLSLFNKLRVLYSYKIIGLNYFFKIIYYFGANVISLIFFIIFKPNKINVTEAYNSNSPFIVTGNLLKICTCEYQHGLISKSHIGYTMTFTNEFYRNIYLPKSMYLWSLKWKKFVDLEKNNKIKFKEWTYEYFYNFNSEKLFNKKNKINILIIGQPSISIELQRLTLSLSKLYSTYNIVYKAHPKEIIIDSFLSENINIRYDNLYDLLISSKIVIGGFSTALLEAQSLKCNVLSFEEFVPVEYKNVLEGFNIKFISDLDNISNFEYVTVDSSINLNKEILWI